MRARWGVLRGLQVAVVGAAALLWSSGCIRVRGSWAGRGVDRWVDRPPAARQDLDERPARGDLDEEEYSTPAASTHRALTRHRG